MPRRSDAIANLARTSGSLSPDEYSPLGVQMLEMVLPHFVKLPALFGQPTYGITE
jgi:hypothetical protein